MAESEAEYVPSFSAHKADLRNPLGVKTAKEKEIEKPSLSIITFGESKKKKPLIKFSVQHIFLGLPTEERMTAAKWHLAYKFVKNECKIVRNILHQHCFKEVHPNSSEFNIMWTGSHLKPHTLHGLQEFQKINHFPRSYELTRKDRLYQNIQKMQNSKGLKNFDFIPEAYVLPAEYDRFFNSYAKQRGLWIVKPVASSRGRGIFLVNHPSQVPFDDTLLVSKYIVNPLLVDGFKFDLRLYVGVTSFDPLRIYLYEEGLTRFATVKYDQSNKNMKNSCMHLTNYSVNKKSEDYVSCNDPEIEDYGNKWSLGALLRFLKNKGIDTKSLVGKIEDVVIKTIIAGELPIATACKMFMPFPGNCFEIYGFDVLIDEKLKPWLLEVNLSPSMACDSPMDLKIKSNLLTDMFNLTGFLAQDPLIKKVPIRKNVGQYVRNQRQRCHSAGLTSTRALSGSSSNVSGKPRQIFMESERGLSTDELRVLRETKDEYLRRGSFVRIFPSPNSRELYSSYLEYRTTNNRMLSTRLFMEKASRKISYAANEDNLSDKAMPTYQYGQTLLERMVCYERQLPSLVTERQKRSSEMTERVHKTDTKYPGQNSLTQGQLEVRSSQVVTSSQPVDEAPAIALKLAAMEHSELTVEMADVIQKASSLSKLQARKAFGMYLQRVKQRLIKEASCDYDDSGDEGEKDKQDEQMNLVIRFLKRAARNLRQEFQVVIPSYKLPIHDRRRILAQQLGDFVHIYDRETAQMEDQGNVEDESGVLSEKEFKIFLAMASESELEELLTEYTKVNNNASIFLGNSKSKPTSSLRITNPALQRQTETRKHFRSHSAHALTTTNTQEVKMKYKSDQAMTRMADQNRRLAGAVAAYGKSLAFNATRTRPASASVSTERKRLTATSLMRPVSAKVSTNKPILSTVEFDSSHAITNEKSVSDVLKKLARRQAVRQYEAKLALNIETNKWVQPVGMVSNTGMINKDSMKNHKTENVHPCSQLESRNSNADETFCNFVNYKSTSQHGHPKVPRKNQEFKNQHLEEIVRESPPVQVAKAFSASEIRIPCGESEVVMEDKLGSARGDYNKHMQLLIERLAAHKFNKTSKEEEEVVVPKPPSRPRSAKRPVSAQRMSRITSAHGSRE